MAAALTVQQVSPSLNSTARTLPLTPRHGVLTLFGYGITVRVDRGHLIVEDGIGTPRRQARFARIGHELRRLVVIGADGLISLAALRWLADQKAAFVMLNRDGRVLTTTGPVRSSDSRLRRAQALASHSGVALAIVRALIDQKLAGQERTARQAFGNDVAEAIASARVAVGTAADVKAIRLFESQAAAAYWFAWQAVPVMFPKSDLPRVPDHWRTFGARRSPLSSSPRLAVNPTNAILNYLYALLEAEARLAAAALGLDPGMGVMHVDTDARDSFACDLMEPVRPQVDAYVLNWITSEPLRREWFFEQRDGTCRLMGDFAARLSETTQTWGRAVAPVAERVAAMLWATIESRGARAHPTRLTQRRRREAHRVGSEVAVAPPRPPAVCHGCGTPIASGRTYCMPCGATSSRERMPSVAAQGRQASHTADAEARRVATQRRNALAQHAWNASDQPAWLDEATYTARIQPRLHDVKLSILSSAIGVSQPYAVSVRSGQRRPHPRHWLTLARLVGVTEESV